MCFSNSFYFKWNVWHIKVKNSHFKTNLTEFYDVWRSVETLIMGLITCNVAQWLHVHQLSNLREFKGNFL